MREFRFKAWHKIAREFLNVNKSSEAFRWKEEGQPIVILQYMGLNDKNDIEIYEGDIISDGIEKLVVVFKDGAFMLKNNQGHYFFPHEGLCRSEVIGNIHENPELMEK